MINLSRGKSQSSEFQKISAPKNQQHPRTKLPIPQPHPVPSIHHEHPSTTRPEPQKRASIHRPCHDAGKQSSSHNSQSHGCSASPKFSLLPNEDPKGFAVLIERIRVEMQPATEHEGFLVGLIAQARGKRARSDHEMELLDQLVAGESVESKIALMMRYAAHAERAYYRAHRDNIQSRRQRENTQEAAPIGQVRSPNQNFSFNPPRHPDWLCLVKPKSPVPPPKKTGKWLRLVNTLNWSFPA